jgi:hypothetical protein
LAASAAPAPADASAPFSASRTLGIADHFRIPYAVGGAASEQGLHRLRADGGPALLWPGAAEQAGPPVAAVIETGPDGGIPIFGQVLADHTASALLSAHGGNWSRAIAVGGGTGIHMGSIWRSDDGGVFLPFDPDEVCLNYLSERYQELLPGRHRDLLRWATLRCWYQVRRVLPRAAQIWLRRRYAPIQARSEFPRWPAETALHDLFDLCLGLVAGLTPEPLPYIAAWPDGRAWALVLTHDVETGAGLRALRPIAELERGLGVRSSWNFVPGRYEVDDALITELTQSGFEVGVHGLYHDGRDLASLEHIRERLPAMRAAAERWGAVGFRSPATHRTWEWMPMLGFDYDSSSPDADPFEPQAGGCCSWLPFFNGDMVELPLTLAQDHTLFVILGQHDESTWVQKTELLKLRGGMALIVTHPDYHGAHDLIAPAYERFLGRYGADETCWCALPREVSDWWRRRAASRLERVGGDWVVTGPAKSQARIAFAEPWRWR